VSHLGFASIKAAICSSDAAAAAGGTASPVGLSGGGGTACIPPLVPATAASTDVATAVAAALSPRATQAQAQALAGVFGGGSFIGTDGVVIGPGKPACARRMPWGIHEDSSQTPSKVCAQVHVCVHVCPRENKPWISTRLDVFGAAC
jgi:hypothetical protein